MITENAPGDLQTIVTQRFEQSMAVPEAFFAHEAECIAEACWAMARRFHQRGRLLAFGNGACSTDAQHIAVEFMHPVIVGKRALPALALSSLPPGDDPTLSFVHQLHALAHPQDIAVGFSLTGNDANVTAALDEARRMGLLTLGLTGENSGLFRETAPDFLFSVDSPDPLVIQETHETLYHVLWELVHIFFEHEGLLT